MEWLQRNGLRGCFTAMFLLVSSVNSQSTGMLEDRVCYHSGQSLPAGFQFNTCVTPTTPNCILGRFILSCYVGVNICLGQPQEQFPIKAELQIPPVSRNELIPGASLASAPSAASTCSRVITDRGAEIVRTRVVSHIDAEQCRLIMFTKDNRCYASNTPNIAGTGGTVRVCETEPVTLTLSCETAQFLRITSAMCASWIDTSDVANCNRDPDMHSCDQVQSFFVAGLRQNCNGRSSCMFDTIGDEYMEVTYTCNSHATTPPPTPPPPAPTRPPPPPTMPAPAAVDTPTTTTFSPLLTPPPVILPPLGPALTPDNPGGILSGSVTLQPVNNVRVPQIPNIDGPPGTHPGTGSRGNETGIHIDGQTPDQTNPGDGGPADTSNSDSNVAGEQLLFGTNDEIYLIVLGLIGLLLIICIFVGVCVTVRRRRKHRNVSLNGSPTSVAALAYAHQHQDMSLMNSEYQGIPPHMMQVPSFMVVPKAKSNNLYESSPSRTISDIPPQLPAPRVVPRASITRQPTTVITDGQGKPLNIVTNSTTDASGDPIYAEIPQPNGMCTIGTLPRHPPIPRPRFASTKLPHSVPEDGTQRGPVPLRRIISTASTIPLTSDPFDPPQPLTQEQKMTPPYMVPKRTSMCSSNSVKLPTRISRLSSAGSDSGQPQPTKRVKSSQSFSQGVKGKAPPSPKPKKLARKGGTKSPKIRKSKQTKMSTRAYNGGALSNSAFVNEDEEYTCVYGQRDLGLGV